MIAFLAICQSSIIIWFLKRLKQFSSIVKQFLISNHGDQRIDPWWRRVLKQALMWPGRLRVWANIILMCVLRILFALFALFIAIFIPLFTLFAALFWVFWVFCLHMDRHLFYVNFSLAFMSWYAVLFSVVEALCVWDCVEATHSSSVVEAFIVLLVLCFLLYLLSVTDERMNVRTNERTNFWRY